MAARERASKRRVRISGIASGLSTMVSSDIVVAVFEGRRQTILQAAPMPTIDLDTLSIKTIRTLSMDAVQQANSGHPGTPMAMAPVAYCLWQRHLRFDPNDPIWPDRDRFVLSMGHA